MSWINEILGSLIVSSELHKLGHKFVVVGLNHSLEDTLTKDFVELEDEVLGSDRHVPVLVTLRASESWVQEKLDELAELLLAKVVE